MTKINMTNANLLELDRQRQIMRGSFIELLLLSKINSFYQNNGIRIQNTHEKRNAILAKYYVAENNAVRQETIIVDEKPKQQAVLLEGMSREEAENELKDFLAAEVAVSI